MKVDKISLEVNGREMTFSEKELRAILEEHFSSKTKQVTTAKVAQKPTEDVWFEVKPQTIDQKLLFSEVQQETKMYEIAATPTEGKCFEVRPLSINQGLFQKERADYYQEDKRQVILEAFEELKKNPEKYGKKFYTMFPEKTWNKATTFKEIEELAYKLGDHNADWVEQALEWAQRISNGESWWKVCNKSDTANWFRLVVWKTGLWRMIGGSCSSLNHCYPASEIHGYNELTIENVQCTVPLVVLYEK